MTRTAVVDGDSLVYRCGFAVEKTFYLVEHKHDSVPQYDWFKQFESAKEAKDHIKEAEGFSWPSITWTRKEIEPLDHCLATVKNCLAKIKEMTEASQTLIYLSGKGNFRETLYPEYKANRATMTKPKYYSDIRTYLTDYHGASVVDGMEADDKVAIAALECGNSIIVSQDKDLGQVPGKHYNWVTGNFTTVSPEQGMRFFYEQVLSGDPTDNVPGLQGIGPKKAQAIIAGAKTPREIAEAVYKTYESALGHRPDSEVDLMARLVWIWRKPDDKHPLWRHMGREAA